MVHRDFHIGNILLILKQYQFIYNENDGNDDDDSDDDDNDDDNGDHYYFKYKACISDMGLCRKIGDNNETSIYGVMPYIAPEVLRKKPYTQAADIYGFDMIMYVVATGMQPFADRAHDEILALNIVNGIRPEINEPIAPKCYIDLMNKCW